MVTPSLDSEIIPTRIVPPRINNAPIHEDVYYNLNGQRVDRPSKGVYIKDGKKIIIR